MSVRVASALGGLLALACLLTVAAHARAAYDPLATGVTKVKLDPRFLALLRHNNVKLIANGGAKLKGKTLSFPFPAASSTRWRAPGTVEQQGALVFGEPGLDPAALAAAQNDAAPRSLLGQARRIAAEAGLGAEAEEQPPRLRQRRSPRPGLL